MSKPVIVKVIVEGQTEESFIKRVLAPNLFSNNIFMTPKILAKKGQKGGNVTFEHVKTDAAVYLRQSNVTAVSCFVDYYGLKEWPNKDTIAPNATPKQIADILNGAAKAEMCTKYDVLDPAKRFIPFVMVHEFETLLFSDAEILAQRLGIAQKCVEATIEQCGSPEQINNSRETAPSKRLLQWTDNHYNKVLTGIEIAQAIGIDKMRQACPLFNEWLTAIEALQEEA